MFNFDSGRYAAKVAEYLEQHFVPQFTTSRDLFAALYTRKAIRGPAALLVAGVGVNRNPTVAGVSNPYNAVTVAVETNVTPNYFWSHYFGMTLVSYEELKVSTSEGAVLDILEERLNDTMESFYELVADHLLSSTAASKDRVNGIGYMLATTGSFGGIDRAANTWWRASQHRNRRNLHLAEVQPSLQPDSSARGHTAHHHRHARRPLLRLRIAYPSVAAIPQRPKAGGAGFRQLPAQRRGGAVRQPNARRRNLVPEHAVLLSHLRNRPTRHTASPISRPPCLRLCP
jgi:hypothetical protein